MLASRTFFVLLIAGGVLASLRAQNSPPTIPLCPGLTIVTAVNQAQGDYESIKTVEEVTDAEVRLKYSSERLVSDMFSSEPPKLHQLNLRRAVRRADLESAHLYLQEFSPELPDVVPETTALGTSAAVLNALKTTGETKMGIFIAFSQNKPSLDRTQHPNVYDNAMVVPVQRVGSQPVMMPVLVNDTVVELPAIHAQGDFFGDKAEFFFLDDPANPIALKFRLGIGRGGGAGLAEAMAKALAAEGITLPQDRDVLQVIKISHDCGGPPPAGGGGGGGAPGGTGTAPGGAGGGAAALERALADTGRADVYSIHFTFDSDVIREESEPTLKEIADVLARNASWSLAINGHTDGIGSDKYNLDLSRRRAAAVKDALVKRYGIAAGRLTTAGMGESQPKDTNETLEGRARNRRVELVRR